jgi:hypothetical protein
LLVRAAAESAANPPGFIIGVSTSEVETPLRGKKAPADRQILAFSLILFTFS